jgi:hypothetical protein
MCLMTLKKRQHVRVHTEALKLMPSVIEKQATLINEFHELQRLLRLKTVQMKIVSSVRLLHG